MEYRQMEQSYLGMILLCVWGKGGGGGGGDNK